jgi:hypothetical protein
MDTMTFSPTILERSTIVSIRTGRLGIRRKVDPDRVKLRRTLGQQIDDEDPTEPRESMVSVSKTLIDCPEYDAIQSADNKVRGKVAELALPLGLRAGSYLIADGTIDQVDTIIEEWRARRDSALVPSFLHVYDAAVRDAVRKLGDLGDVSEYPPVDVVAEAFRVRVSWSAWGTPARLRSLNARIFDREQERSTRELHEAAAEVRRGMRLALLDRIAHLIDVLTPDPDGKIRTFRDSTVEHLTTFLGSFADRNIVGDTELAEIVAYVREKLQDVDARSLRVAPLVRRLVLEDLAVARRGLGELLGDPLATPAPAPTCPGCPGKEGPATE